MPDANDALSNVAVIIFAVEVAKGFGVPSRFAPIAAVLAGILMTFGHNWGSLDSVETATDLIAAGTFWGLSAIGTHKGLVKQIQEYSEAWKGRRRERNEANDLP